MLDVSLLVYFLTLGIFVGFIAGLLGVGGGALMVPILVMIFQAMGVDETEQLPLALGTAMASIVATSASSCWAHHRSQAVLWPVVKALTPGVLLGTFVTSYCVVYFNTTFLALFFSVFIAYVAMAMLVNLRFADFAGIPGRWVLASVGLGIGSISALVSIGGGSLTVPFLSACRTPTKNAIATSAALGLPISVAGALGYLLTNNAISVFEHQVGYVYWPGVLAISSTSIFLAPVGARYTHQLPVSVLKKIFALLLVSLSIKMLLGVLW